MNSPPAPLRSMTGYALVRRATAIGELTIGLRAVNHRGLDLHFHLSGDLAPFENAIRAVLKQKLARGHVEVRGSVARTTASGRAAYNRDLVAAYVAGFRDAAAQNELTGEPDLNVALALPGAIESATGPENLDGAFETEVVACVAACADELNAYREREGASLVQEFHREYAGIEESRIAIEAIRATATTQFQRRLRERLMELLSQSSISEARLAEEAAILADRSDVQEELARLRVHSGELNRILDHGGEVGKRLDFLLQEMNRETNTILSKTSGIGEIGLTVTNRALAIKAHIEKIREQALNLE
ncbi:MAG: YicC family protein [Acidobacteriaceae bacterium]|nr:YicC family protein [Acidobacteriaceae bacterium]